MEHWKRFSTYLRQNNTELRYHTTSKTSITPAQRRRLRKKSNIEYKRVCLGLNVPQ